MDGVLLQPPWLGVFQLFGRLSRVRGRHGPGKLVEVCIIPRHCYAIHTDGDIFCVVPSKSLNLDAGFPI